MWLACTNEGLYRNFNVGKLWPFSDGDIWTMMSENLLSSFNQLTYARASFDGPLYCSNISQQKEIFGLWNSVQKTSSY